MKYIELVFYNTAGEALQFKLLERQIVYIRNSILSDNFL